MGPRAAARGKTVSTPRLVPILSAVRDGAATLREIAEVSGTPRGIAAVCLRKYRLAGLLTRTGTPRRYRYSLTAAGRARLAPPPAALVWQDEAPTRANVGERWERREYIPGVLRDPTRPVFEDAGTVYEWRGRALIDSGRAVITCAPGLRVEWARVP